MRVLHLCGWLGSKNDSESESESVSESEAESESCGSGHNKFFGHIENNWASSGPVAFVRFSVGLMV